MKLTFDQIKNLTFGFDHSWVDGDCIRFRRYS